MNTTLRLNIFDIICLSLTWYILFSTSVSVIIHIEKSVYIFLFGRGILKFFYNDKEELKWDNDSITSGGMTNLL